MVALFYKTVPAIEVTRIRSLRDLGRCKTAIKDGASRDEDISIDAARHRYLKASNKAPLLGNRSYIQHIYNKYKARSTPPTNPYEPSTPLRNILLYEKIKFEKEIMVQPSNKHVQ